MHSVDMRTSSDSEEETIASAINDDDDDGVRYSLRSRSILKSDAMMVDASTGMELNALANQTPSSSDARTTVAVSNASGDRTGATDARAQTQHTRITSDPRDGDHHHDVEDGGAERNRWRSIAGVASPFELIPARSGTSTGRMQAPARSAQKKGPRTPMEGGPEDKKKSAGYHCHFCVIDRTSRMSLQ